MKKLCMTLVIFILGLFTLSCLANSKGCEFNGVDYKLATAFVSEFIAAVKEDDKNKIAGMMSYPLRVNPKNGSRSYTIKSKREFLQQYDELFSENMKKGLTADADIFCNYQGGSIGAGRVWFEAADGKAVIYSINPS